LDNCYFNRPYDDQSQEKIYLEGEAVLAIIRKAKQEDGEIYGSPALDLEIERTGRKEKRRIWKMNITINLNSPVEIRRAGLQALKEALGPVGMVKFIQQYENGNGDYTKEKYDQEDLTIDEIDSLLRARQDVSSQN
jgi:hypothetical protein